MKNVASSVLRVKPTTRNPQQKTEVFSRSRSLQKSLTAHASRNSKLVTILLRTLAHFRHSELVFRNPSFCLEANGLNLYQSLDVAESVGFEPVKIDSGRK